MAATAVYVAITRVPITTEVRPEAPVTFSNIAATTAAFGIDGGQYTIDAIGLTFGTVTLNKLGPDGTTFLAADTAFAANGVHVVNLAPGTYQIAIA